MHFCSSRFLLSFVLQVSLDSVPIAAPQNGSQGLVFPLPICNRTDQEQDASRSKTAIRTHRTVSISRRREPLSKNKKANNKGTRVRASKK
jgi:hypothetical protein